MNVFAKSILTILIIILISETAFSQESGIYFGIHETCKLKDLPESFAVKAKEVLSETENPKNPAIIGYINADAVDILDDLQKDLVSEEIVLRTTHLLQIDKSSLLPVVAVKQRPAIIISDIKKTVPHETAVEIRFTMKGAKKFAAMTKNNVGKFAAFIIGDEIISLPLINAEIKHGVALIAGLADIETAKEISESLNATL